MKQFIVMISMVILGVAIAGFVGEFQDKADTMTDNALNSVSEINTELKI